MMWRWILGLVYCAMSAAEPAVYQWRAADGALVFSDRPPPHAGVPIGRQPVPQGNVIGRFRTLPGASKLPRTAPEIAAKEQSGRPNASCVQRRQALAALWLKRRRGYRATEAEALKRQIRELQTELKRDCGQWR